MIAEDFDMQNYPVQINGKPASRIWRISYLDEKGTDRFLPWRFESDVTFLDDQSIVDIELKNLRGKKITSVRMGCVFYQEEIGGAWKETKLQEKWPQSEHYYEGTYTKQYWELRPEAYKRMGVRDIFKLTKPVKKEDVLEQKNAELEKKLSEMQEQIKKLMPAGAK